MSNLQIFIGALEDRLNEKYDSNHTLVCKYNIVSSGFGGCKKLVQEVWDILEKDKILIATSEHKVKIVNEEDLNKAKETLDYLTIFKLLEYYGI